MGKVNNVLNRYFQDKERFADLFNGIYFQGKTVIAPSQLELIPTSYYEAIPQPSKPFASKKTHSSKKHTRREYNRDVNMRLNTGETLQLLALENQDSIDYTMPFRCMQYDTFEYHSQLKVLQAKNSDADDFDTP